ncbi:MAG: amino acid adenylation domain-containing protein, partial [Porcipelethomonas sp.]
MKNVNTAEDLCYVLFTSGSTGNPKAAMISHYNLSNFTSNNNNNNPYQCNMINNCATVMAVTTFVFDISVFEIYLSLINGLKVVLSNEEENVSAELLANLITKHHVDVVHSTPTKFLMYLENKKFQEAVKNIKMLMIGAEVFTQEIYNTISKYTNATIYNGYGPTETTIGVTFKRINNKPCVHELFSEQAAKTPDKIALVFEDKQFTYKQLDEMSNSLAHYLREKGVKPNDVVPIIAKRSWHIIVAMLGILKAGGAFFLLDHKYPAGRINYLVSEVRANYVLSYGCKMDNAIDLSTFDLDKTTPIVNINTCNDLTCVIHTSGSTGKPKAASLTHNNLYNYINYAEKFFIGTKQVIASTTVTFDAFILETIVALCNNTSVVLLNENQITKQADFECITEKYSGSFMFHTPTKLLNYIRNSHNSGAFLKHIKSFVLGGEVFSEELYSKITSQNADCNIFNIYGPTETTICATVDDVSDIDITIGKPIANTQIYILDKNRKPLPIGVAGELCISGDGVGKGYLNRPELTAEKFIPNPFIEGKTMYCTGDLARWRADGEIEYLGRIDTQVKIRGLRIELGEIESVMSSFEGIHLTAVTDKRDENNRQYLVGYYTADTEIDEKVLRQYLSEKLPKYMVPNFFIHLDNMPMTASGKTDRKNLPLPDFSSNLEEYVAPVTDTEKTLAEIWTEILHFDRIGRYSDFIECGGDSLAAITLLAEIEEKFGINAELKMIMEHTVLSDLAECIDNSELKSESIPALHTKEYILTPQQKAIYLACQKDKSSLIYNMPMFIKLSDNTDIAVLKAKIQKCYRNHSVLRTAIAVRNDEITGVIDDEAELIFEQFNSRKDFVRPFDLSKAPLIRVGFGEGGIAIDIHHIVGDGESLNIILDEIFNDTELSETVSYTDYAEYIHHKLESGEFSEHKNYFKNALHVDMEPLELPEATNSKYTETNYTYILNNESVNAVKDFAKTYDLTDTCAYLSLYGILMSEFANKKQVVTSIILSNRMHSETRYTCGMFVNTIPLVLDVDPELTLRNYAEQLNNSLLDIYKYQELPFLEICEAAGIKDKNIINSTFVYQPGEMKINGLDFEYIDTYTHKMDLSFQVIPQSDGSCKVMLEYNNTKYDKYLMERLTVGYERLISQIKANKKLNELDVMGKAEYQQVVYGFNNTS